MLKDKGKKRGICCQKKKDSLLKCCFSLSSTCYSIKHWWLYEQQTILSVLYQTVLPVDTLSVKKRKFEMTYGLLIANARFKWNLLHRFYNCTWHTTFPFHFKCTTVWTEVDDCSLIVSSNMSVHLSFFFHSVFIKFTIFSFFLYIANLACNSADDVDGRQWLVGLMVMSIYRVTTNRPRSLSLFSFGRYISSPYPSSASSFLRSVHVVCVCMMCAWLSLRRRERERERCAFVYYRLKGEKLTTTSARSYLYT